MRRTKSGPAHEQSTTAMNADATDAADQKRPIVFNPRHQLSHLRHPRSVVV
jgi:hypothetical protein